MRWANSPPPPPMRWARARAGCTILASGCRPAIPGPTGSPPPGPTTRFGRKTLEVRADGTRTSWSYQFCSGIAGGTASCPSGGATLVQTTPLAADGTTHIGPVTTAYFDQLGRGIATDTEGFDGSAIRAATQYDAQGRVAQKSRPYFVSGGSPRWTTYTYDTLGRVLTETYPDSRRHDAGLSRPLHHSHQRAGPDEHHRQEQPGPDGHRHRRGRATPRATSTSRSATSSR